MREVRIRRVVLDEIVAHARAELPNECCGLLIGTPEVINRARRARNLESSPTRYLIDPADHFAAIKQARAESLAVMGAYHSHPASPPVPSPTDTLEANDPELLYLIAFPGTASLAPDVRAYRFDGRNFRPVALVPVA